MAMSFNLEDSGNRYLKEQYCSINKNKPYGHHSNRYYTIGDRVEEIVKIVVHQFTVDELDDPELYAAQPLYEWEQSEKGQWIMKNSREPPIWQRNPIQNTYETNYKIVATLTGTALTEWLIRYGKQ